MGHFPSLPVTFQIKKRVVSSISPTFHVLQTTSESGWKFLNKVGDFYRKSSLFLEISPFFFGGFGIFVVICSMNIEKKISGTWFNTIDKPSDRDFVYVAIRLQKEYGGGFQIEVGQYDAENDMIDLITDYQGGEDFEAWSLWQPYTHTISKKIDDEVEENIRRKIETAVADLPGNKLHLNVDKLHKSLCTQFEPPLLRLSATLENLLGFYKKLLDK